MANNNSWPGWKTVKQIGKGSFGKVYEIEKEENGALKREALKVISVPAKPEDIQELFDIGIATTNREASTFIDSQIENVSQEFKTMAELRGNRNIVEFHDYMIIPHEGWMGADILIRMELLTPMNLRTHTLSAKETARLGVDMCSALEACQSKRPPILHRDIKMENIMMDDQGNYKLGDFGVARVMEGTKSAHTKAGTEDYMAPEVVQMKGYFATADLYSLGIVLYRLLNNNRNPFLPTEGGLTEQIHLSAKARRIGGERAPMPLYGSIELKKAVLKALEYDPKDRYQTATEFRWALEQCPEMSEDSGIEDDDFYEEPTDSTVRQSAIWGTVKEQPKQENVDGTVNEQPHQGIVGSTVKERSGRANNKVGQEKDRDTLNEANHQETGTVVESGTGKADSVVSNQEKKRNNVPLMISALIVILVIILVVAVTSKKDAAHTPVGNSGTTAQSEGDEASIVAEKTSIDVGESVELAYEIGDYTLRNDDSLEWSSEDEDIAIIDTRGVVTGVSPGEVTVSGTYKGKTCTIQINVNEAEMSEESAVETSSDSTAQSNSERNYGDSIEVFSSTTTILAGDSVYPKLKAGDWTLDSASQSIKWSSDDPSIGKIGKNGAIIGVSPGTFNVTAEFEGMTDELEMTVVEVDSSSEASISADYESVSLTSGGEDTVNISFEGNMPEQFGATAYYSAGISLSLSWGEMQDNRADLTIKDLFSSEKEGEVTIIAYESDHPTHVVASKKIHIKVN